MSEIGLNRHFISGFTLLGIGLSVIASFPKGYPLLFLLLTIAGGYALIGLGCFEVGIGFREKKKRE